MSNNDAGGSEHLLQWLDERIEDAKHHHRRDTNPRHDALTKGKIQAYNDLRIRLVGEAHNSNNSTTDE